MTEKTVFFRWTENISVQSVEIDNQHKELVSMLNEMYEAFMNKEHQIKIGSILDKMWAYTKYHFNTEERYFTLFNYDDKLSHLKEHELFRTKVELFMEKYRSSNTALTYEVMNFLRNWLNTHILETDHKYISCFVQNGVK